MGVIQISERFFERQDLRGLTLRLYRLGDEDQVTARLDFARAFEAEGRRLPDGPKWTLARGDEVLGVGGFEGQGNGRWAAWSYLSDMTPRQWWFAALMARAAVGYLRRAFHAPWIQAVAADHPGAGRLLERIGFERTRVSVTGQGALYLMGGV